MNKVILVGNLVRDVEVRQTQNGVSNASFTLAVTRKFKNADGTKETDFINIVAWRQLADVCGKYLSKGSKVGVTGSLQTRTYQAQDGSKRYVTEVVADDIEFLGAKGERPNENTADAPQQKPVQQTQLSEYTDEDLPF